MKDRESAEEFATFGARTLFVTMGNLLDELSVLIVDSSKWEEHVDAAAKMAALIVCLCDAYADDKLREHATELRNVAGNLIAFRNELKEKA